MVVSIYFWVMNLSDTWLAVMCILKSVLWKFFLFTVDILLCDDIFYWHFAYMFCKALFILYILGFWFYQDVISTTRILSYNMPHLLVWCSSLFILVLWLSFPSSANSYSSLKLHFRILWIGQELMILLEEAAVQHIWLETENYNYHSRSTRLVSEIHRRAAMNLGDDSVMVLDCSPVNVVLLR